jgi:hypothetical protein
MAEAAAHHGESLEELRLLTEVNNLRANLLPDGALPEAVLDDVKTNIFTAVQEMAIPAAVTTTVQRVESELDGFGRSRRVITWLGKSAIDVAESGYQFHFSQAAHRRVGVEVAEARYSQENLRPGIAQVFISPKMSEADAPAEIAKQEHLHDDDAVRVSRPVVDKAGVVVARRMESLLVSDIPLGAWVAMLQDPHNIFGKSIILADAGSAVSVMEAFRELEIDEEKVPQGPVSILKALKPYMPASQQSVFQEKIEKYETSQEFYKAKAEAAAEEWLQFDVELARSLEQGTGNYEIQRFIAILQDEWKPRELATIFQHDVDGEYIMTAELAALLEKKKRQVLASRVALATGNSKVMAQADAATVTRLQSQIADLETRRSQMSDDEYAMREAELMRSIAKQNFKVGGGCAGSVGGEDDSDGGETTTDEFGNEIKREESETWTWKKGVCRVKKCLSPKPTYVGPCDVCRACQHKFDIGQDPTKGEDIEVMTSAPAEEQEDKATFELQEIIKTALKSASHAQPVPV